MSEPFKGKSCRIHHDADMSDALTFQAGDRYLTILAEDLFRFVSERHPEVPSLEATAKLYHERERRDRWCQFMAAAMSNASLFQMWFQGKMGENSVFIEVCEDFANDAVGVMNKTFPPEEPE